MILGHKTSRSVILLNRRSQEGRVGLHVAVVFSAEMSIPYTLGVILANRSQIASFPRLANALFAPVNKLEEKNVKRSFAVGFNLLTPLQSLSHS